MKCSRSYSVLVGNKWIRVKGRPMSDGSLHWEGKNGQGGVARRGMWK